MAHEQKATLQKNANREIVSVTVPDLSGSYATQAQLDTTNAAVAAAQSDASNAITAAAAAQGTADGKVTTFFQISPPTAEGVGDLWIDTDDGNKLYRWDGSAWVVVQDAGISAAIVAAADAQSTADGKIVSFYQTTAPTATSIGDLWVDTDDGNHLYRWDGSAWVTVRDATIAAAQADASTAIANAATAQSAANNAQATADGKIVTFYQASPPTGQAVGDLWVDSDDRQLYRWTGSAWVTMQDTGIATALSDAANAQATADGKIVTFYQTTPPTASAVGDLWVDTDDNNHLWRWSGSSWVSVRDATIAQAQADASTAIANAATAQTAADNAQATADGKIVTFYQSTAPATASVGDLWVDSDDRQLYRYNGTSWVTMQDTGIATALSDAANAQATADGKIVTFYQTSAPTAVAVGDLWVDTDDSNRLYRWSGSAWVSVRDTTIDAKIASIGAVTGGKSFRYPLVYSNNTSSVTDNLVIDTPITFGAYMCKVSISGFNYSSTNNINVESSFYAYNVGPAFVNTSTVSSGNKVVTVRLARKVSTGTVSIILTPTSGAWQYPKLTVTEALVTLTTPPDTFLSGWSVASVPEASIAASYDLVTTPPARDVLGEITSAQSAASAAQTTANGKNTVFYSATAPTANAVNDLWFETDNGNKPYRWDGSSWVAQPLGDAAIANLDAGKVTAGVLQGITVRTAGTGAYVALETTGSVDRITFPSGAVGELVPNYIQTLTDGSGNPTLSFYPGSVTNPTTNAGLDITEGLVQIGSLDASGETWVEATSKVRFDVSASTVAEMTSDGLYVKGFKTMTTATTGFTVATGWSVNAWQWVNFGGLVQAYLKVTRTGANIAGSTSGNITNFSIGTIGQPLDVSPGPGHPVVPISAASVADGIMVGGLVWTDGGVGVGALPPGVGVNTNDALSFSITYLTNDW